MMNFANLHIEYKGKIDSIYDMASLSYDYIMSVIENEELFVGEYLIENSKAEKNNPNIKKLLDYYENIYKKIKVLDTGIEIENIFEELTSSISSVEKELITFGNENENFVTPVVYLLMAIDRYCGTLRDSIRTHMPLNHVYKEKTLIYYNISSDYLDEAREELKFGERVGGRSINNCLNNLSCVNIDIIEKGMDPISIFPLYFEEKYGVPQNIPKKKLDIAIIPFNGFKMTNFKQMCGTLYGVEYIDGYNQEYSLRAKKLLEKAIEQKANIIVFPEYICSEEIQNEIGEYLKKTYYDNPERLKELLFVVAGTGWINNNNVAKIFDKSGYLLGNHYKVARFVNGDMTENLTTPGKERLLIDINSVGRFMPAICRDIPDGRKVEQIIDVFRPFEILVPAWSTSINRGFKGNFCNFSSKYHLSAILCNSCEPFCSKRQKSSEGEEEETELRKDINIIVTPFKKKEMSCVEGKVYAILRKDECMLTCKEQSCIFMVNMNYSIANIENANIVTKCEQLS